MAKDHNGDIVNDKPVRPSLELTTPERPIPFWCRYGRHKWGKWVEKRRGKILSGEREIGKFVDLERKCVFCGELKLKTVQDKM